jgi:tryptophan synthase alpha chain
MNRLRTAFASPATAGRGGLLPYVTAGYPDLVTTVEILRRIDPACCRCVELGIPFSDPIADGPVIQASFARALAAGFRVDDLFAALRRCRDEIAVPLVAMLSYSIVYRRGPQAFVREAREAGFDGVIVPDLALEEADDLAALAGAADCPLVLMVAPTSPAERRRRIAAISEPFIYYQSVAGVTGERAALPADLVEQVRALRNESGKPVCVGFGISRPEQVAAVCDVADGAIVGSAIVRRMTAAIERGDEPGQIAEAVRAFIDDLWSPLTRITHQPPRPQDAK